jgi:hypothetical protein
VASVGQRGSLGTINQVAVTFGIFVSMILGLEEVLGDSGKQFSFFSFYFFNFPSYSFLFPLFPLFSFSIFYKSLFRHFDRKPKIQTFICIVNTGICTLKTFFYQNNWIQ